jgi:thioredoxin-related protein
MNKVSRGSTITFIVVLCCSVVSAAGSLSWRTSWSAVQGAARKSGKPIIAYIYENERPACVEMEKTTYSDAKVVAALKSFELLALNGDSQASRAFCEHYKVGTRFFAREDQNRDERSAVPAFLFLDADGREYYRTHGFYPPDAFVQVLGQVSKVIEYQCALAKQPDNARAAADLAHLYLLLTRPELALPLLKQAIQCDPNNDAGARADAELDQIIVSIPDDPELGFRNLIAYQFNRPETKRALEIKYYMAVAQLAAGKDALAEKILLDFASIPPFLPDDSPVQGAQYGYQVEKGDRIVGFWDLDDIAQVREKVRALPEDPDKCKYVRRPMNPDYRNPWTAQADLLLKQLRAAQAAPKPPAH